MSAPENWTALYKASSNACILAAFSEETIAATPVTSYQDAFALKDAKLIKVIENKKENVVVKEENVTIPKKKEIENKKEKVLETISNSDILVLNDGEARMLFETTNLVNATQTSVNGIIDRGTITENQTSSLYLCLRHVPAGIGAFTYDTTRGGPWSIIVDPEP